jgi:glycosyltransferase involved in cell wall biosynthesis
MAKPVRFFAEAHSAMDLKKNGRILYISSVDVSIGNGPGVNEREFIVAMHRVMGDRAHFLIPQPANEVPDLPANACTFCLPHRRHHPLHFPGHVISQARLANDVLCRKKFDLLLFRLDVLPLAAFYITRKYPIPYALKTLGQGTMNALAERGGWLGRSLMALNRRLVKQIVAKALLADSVSMMQVEQLKHLLSVDSDKIVWTALSANVRKELGLAQFDPIMGYIGTRPWERGGWQLVEVAPRLLSKYPNLGLVILGEGKELDALKRRARELQVETHCRFAGYVPFDKVPLYVNSLDVGVSISVREDRRAASELKVRQYLACGKPVVVSPGSNDFVAVENFGAIVQPMDLQGIAAACDRWLSLTAEERREFACKAVDYMRNNLALEAAITRRFALWTEQLRLRQSDSRN